MRQIHEIGLIPKICEIGLQLPYTTWNEFRYYNKAYAGYAVQCVSYVYIFKTA